LKEGRGARLSEIDFDKKLWTIPWQLTHKSSDAMTDHGYSIRKPLMGH
jgi:hypothetical protein